MPWEVLIASLKFWKKAWFSEWVPGLEIFKSKTHVIAKCNGRVVRAADASTFIRPLTDAAAAWKAVEIVDALSNASSVVETEDFTVGRPSI